MKTIRQFKRVSILVVFLVIGVLSSIAQTVSFYVVKKGDTIESIAKKYNVSKDILLTLNQDASKGIYEGMELQIPIGNKQSNYDSNNSTDNYSGSSVNFSNNVNTDAQGTWEISYELGYGFLKKEEGANGSAYEYRATFGANYVLPYGLYSGIRIGYNSSNYYSYAYANKVSYSGEITCHLLCIPLELGYRATFNSAKTAGIAPFAGIDLNVGLSGKQKVKINKDEESVDLKIGGKIGIGARIGLRLLIWGFDVTGSYVFPLNDKQKGYFGEKSFPEISIGCGF